MCVCVCVCVCLHFWFNIHLSIFVWFFSVCVCVCVFLYFMLKIPLKQQTKLWNISPLPPPSPLPHWFPMIYKIRHHNWPKDKTDRRYALVSPWWNYSYRLCAATLWMTCERLETKPRDLGLALWLNWTFLLYFLSLSLSLCFFLLFVLSIICFLFGFFFPSSLYLNFFMTNNFLYFVLAKNFFFLSVWTRMVCTL